MLIGTSSPLLYSFALQCCCRYTALLRYCILLPCSVVVDIQLFSVTVFFCPAVLLSIYSSSPLLYSFALQCCCRYTALLRYCILLPCSVVVDIQLFSVTVFFCPAVLLSIYSSSPLLYSFALQCCCRYTALLRYCILLPCSVVVDIQLFSVTVFFCPAVLLSIYSSSPLLYSFALQCCCRYTALLRYCILLPCSVVVDIQLFSVTVFFCPAVLLSIYSYSPLLYSFALQCCCRYTALLRYCILLPCSVVVDIQLFSVTVFFCPAVLL